MKIVILGGGNGGAWTALHYGYYTRDMANIDVELIHDPEIDTFPVGQAMFPGQNQLLYAACGTNWYHNEVRAVPKLGILYENWSYENLMLYHEFPFHKLAMQADPKYLQKYILNSGWFTVKEDNVSNIDTVDADVIFDCRGKNVKDQEIEYETLYSPVNSVLLAVGPSPVKPQLWSRHVATVDGWTFVIPNTTDTTSYGYLYNSDITPLETAKQHFSEQFPEASGSYSGHFDHREEVVNLPFESYLAKDPLRVDSQGRKIILNGNRIAFLEPMESTAIAYYSDVARYSFNWILERKQQAPVSDGRPDDGAANYYNTDLEHANFCVTVLFKELQAYINWHYVNGSVYDTPFWRETKTKISQYFEEFKDDDWDEILNVIKNTDSVTCRTGNDIDWQVGYGHWARSSFKLWYDKYIIGDRNSASPDYGTVKYVESSQVRAKNYEVNVKDLEENESNL